MNNTVSGSDEAGIYVGDSSNSNALVRRNTLTDNGFVSGGIVVISTVSFGGSDPTYVQVDNNTLSGNLPGDIVYDGTGHHNTFSANGVPVTLVPLLDCDGE